MRQTERPQAAGGAVAPLGSFRLFFGGVENISVEFVFFCDPEFSQEFPPSALSLEDQRKVSAHARTYTHTHTHTQNV